MLSNDYHSNVFIVSVHCLKCNSYGIITVYYYFLGDNTYVNICMVAIAWLGPSFSNNFTLLHYLIIELEIDLKCYCKMTIDCDKGISLCQSTLIYTCMQLNLKLIKVY